MTRQDSVSFSTYQQRLVHHVGIALRFGEALNRCADHGRHAPAKEVRGGGPLARAAYTQQHLEVRRCDLVIESSHHF